MKVLVLGGGVIGVATAYYLAKAGHEVEVVDRQSGPALETSFGNAGEVSARLQRALGRAGCAHQGHQVDADAAQPAGDVADARPRDVALGRDDAGQLHAEGLCAEQEPHGADCRVQPRLPEGAARRDRHCLRRPRPGHAAALPHPEATRRHRRRRGRAQAVRRALRGAGPRRLLRRRTRVEADAGEVCRRAAPARTTKPAIASCSPTAWPRWRRAWA